MSRVKLSKSMVRRRGWLLLIAAALVIAALLFIYLFIRQDSQIKLASPVYQYYTDQRLDYGAGTRLYLGRYNVIFETKDGRSDGDESPIYTKNTSEATLPNDMGWTDPITGIEWNIPALSMIHQDASGMTWCKSEGEDIALGGGFLCDENGTFLFLDKMTLELNGNTLTLSPMSFYSSSNQMIRVYDYASQTLTVYPALTENACAESSASYRIDLTAGIYTNPQGVYRLLSASASILEDVGKK